MTAALALTAIALLGASLAAVAVLAVRRLLLARDERVRSEREPELRPVAFALIEGQRVDVEALDERGAQVLAALLGRYAQRLSGSSREHIALFFEQHGHVFRELAYISDKRSWRRAVACRSLGDMGSATAVPALLHALGDSDAGVRAAAARSLGALGAVDAVEPLVRALVSRSVPRVIAAQSLLTIGQSALPQLVELSGDEDDAVRGTAVELVGLLGASANAGVLITRLRDPAAEVRARAARALGRLGSRAASEELRAALTDRIPFVRATAAIALGTVGDRNVAGDLVVQAKADVFEPARAAAEALARVDPHRLREEAEATDAGRHLVEAVDLYAARLR